MNNSKRTPILKPPRHIKKYVVKINSENCDGCELCVEFCPREILEIDKDSFNSRMFHPVKIIDPDGCLGCGQCERICPSVSIFIIENDGI